MHTRGRYSEEVQSQGGEQRSILTHLRNHDPPRFKGTRDPDSAEAWIMRLEKEFDYLQVSDSQNVRLATYMLDGEADNWWKGAQDEIRRTKVEVTWEVFVQMFFDR